MIVTGVVVGGSIAAALPAVAATTSACKSTGLKVSFGRIDAGAGQRCSTLNFTMPGGKSCVLRNHLTGFTFVKSGSEGGARSIRARVTREAGSAAESVALQQGRVGHLDLYWNVVDKPFVPESPTFLLPGQGRHVALPWGTPVDQNHWISIGHLHR